MTEQEEYYADVESPRVQVYALSWAGDRIVSASQDGRLIVWNAFTQQKTHAIRLVSAASAVRCLPHSRLGLCSVTHSAVLRSASKDKGLTIPEVLGQD
jgi:WD40 repeat protein